MTHIPSLISLKYINMISLTTSCNIKWLKIKMMSLSHVQTMCVWVVEPNAGKHNDPNPKKY